MKFAWMFAWVGLNACAFSGKAPKPDKPPVASPTPSPAATASPTPSPRLSAQPRGPLTEMEVAAMVENSPCARYSWKNRGRAPIGYVKGFAQVFARAQCNPSPLPITLGSSRLDALSAYGKSPSDLNTYALLLGLGLRESSGKYCVGVDTSASDPATAVGAESGLFQFSMNSIEATKVLHGPGPDVYSPKLKAIMSHYKANPGECALSVFKEEVSTTDNKARFYCRPQPFIGSGPGLEFQKLARMCPAFATEYAALLIRVLKPHFGPLVRKEAEFVPACRDMLENIQTAVRKVGCR